MNVRDRVILVRLVYILSIVFLFQLQVLALIQWLTVSVPPSFQSFHMNPWDPWLSTCPGLVGSDAVRLYFENFACYGTNQTHIGGPYSIFWYWAMLGLSGSGTIPFTIPLMVLCIVQTLLIYRYGSRWASLLFTAVSTVLLISFPQDIFSLVFTAGALSTTFKLWKRVGLLVSAIILKLPIGSEPLHGATLWWFAFGQSVPDPSNWIAYGLLGSFWMIVLGYVIRTRHRHVNDVTNPTSIGRETFPRTSS